MNTLSTEIKPLVYWRKFDEPIIHINIFGKEEKQTGEWACDNPLVKMGWFIGYTSPIKEDEVREKLILLLKDGTRKDFFINSEQDQSEAIEWLNSIQKNNK